MRDVKWSSASLKFKWRPCNRSRIHKSACQKAVCSPPGSAVGDLSQMSKLVALPRTRLFRSSLEMAATDTIHPVENATIRQRGSRERVA